MGPCHTVGDFQQFNPHLHVIGTDGCFSDTGTFSVAPSARTANVQNLFRHQAFKMLKAPRSAASRRPSTPLIGSPNWSP
jgi:hypothetical protein